MEIKHVTYTNADCEIIEEEYIPFEKVIKKIAKRLNISIKDEELEYVAKLITDEIIKIAKSNRPKNNREIKRIILGPVYLDMQLYSGISGHDKSRPDSVAISPNIYFDLLRKVNKKYYKKGEK
jgi:GGDEF domain-containing protein